ncbi:hypothetical protein [Anditalea andensis]|uniref:Signal transduction histidine kinase dimerisation/phosphoacceptor domain-containing protein n=1 Tax=Anditalea andensis TaxID=1048983 RepID=A0A074L2Z6_9BACT|nr:hypothetical protein [Anditalea andensis]KEO75554.1 hypothetical protein EL17_00225 [Anditalea andensis]
MFSEEPHYKVLFEAINKFSIAVFNAGSRVEIGSILREKLKYLINCNAFEFYIIKGDEVEMISQTQAEGESIPTGELEPWMTSLWETGIPLHHIEHRDGNQTELRGWSFKKNERLGSMIIVKSDDKAPFTNRYVTMVKLINEILWSKISNYRLIEELDRKNNRIESLMQEQEKLISLRTQKLLQSNQYLTQLIQFNSHQIREPITRVLSIADLKDEVGMEEWDKEFWPDILRAISDLDQALTSIVAKVERLQP